MAKIPDLPESERPRERLARLGAASLSDAELLAIFLRVGVRGASAIEVGRKLLQKYGTLTDLGGMEMEELAREHGIGPAKAAQLLAAFELGKRCAKEKMHRMPMTSPSAIYQAMAPRLAHERKEHVLVILLDTKLRAVRVIEVSQGNATASLCEPRDVLHQVLVNQATAFVLVHNHPSGDPEPSRQDHRLTLRIRDACELMNLRFVDHMIIGRSSNDRKKPYTSFKEVGIL